MSEDTKKVNKKVSREELVEQQKTRNLQLLELGGKDAKVFIANTIESKEFLSKFIKVDAIAKKARELVGNKLPIESFTTLNEKFIEINKLIDEVIDFGTKENLFFDPKTQKFSYMRTKLVQLISEGKDTPTISKELNVNIKKVESWIKLLDSENKKSSVPTVKEKAPAKAAKVETKTSEAREKVS